MLQGQGADSGQVQEAIPLCIKRPPSDRKKSDGGQIITIPDNYNCFSIFSGSSAALTLSLALIIMPFSSIRYVVRTTPIDTFP